MKGPRHQIDRCACIYIYIYKSHLHIFEQGILSFLCCSLKSFLDLLYKNSQPDFLLVVLLSLILFFLFLPKEVSVVVTKYTAVPENALF